MENEWLGSFEFDSEDQRKGYGAFLKWAKDKGACSNVRPIDLFFIQKDLESSKWLVELVGQQVAELRMEIWKLRNELNSTRGRRP